MKAVINDVHKELIDFYQSLKNGYSTEIYNFMSTHPNEEKEYYKVRDEFKVTTPLELTDIK